jgi:hypothetical protein
VFAGGFAANVLTGIIGDVLGTSTTEILKHVIFVAAGLGIVAVAVIGGATLLQDDRQVAAAPTLREPPVTDSSPPAAPPPPLSSPERLTVVAAALSEASTANAAFAQHYCGELSSLADGRRPDEQKPLPEFPDNLAGTEDERVLANELEAARSDPEHAAALHDAAC